MRGGREGGREGGGRGGGEGEGGRKRKEGRGGGEGEGERERVKESSALHCNESHLPIVGMVVTISPNFSL